jgi:hypothetical protein
MSSSWAIPSTARIEQTQCAVPATAEAVTTNLDLDDLCTVRSNGFSRSDDR